MRILVVEDQDSIRRMIEALVQGRGYEVIAVASGVKAIDVATTDPPDLVLLDLMMPGQYDGFEVCRKLRADPGTRKIPIVIITAMDDDGSRRRATEAGATAYYTKPFSPIALLKEIAKATGNLATVRVARAAGPIARVRYRHDAGLLFQFVLSGSLTIEVEGNGRHAIGEGTAFVLPAGPSCAYEDGSADLELLEVALPAEFETLSP